MHHLLTEQGISLALLSNKVPLKSHPSQHRAYWWQPVTKHYSIYPCKNPCSKASLCSFPQEQAWSIPATWTHCALPFTSAQSCQSSSCFFLTQLCSSFLFCPTPSALAVVWDKKISQPPNILKRRGGKKLLQNITGQTLKAERTSSPPVYQVVLDTATNRLPVL